MLALLITIAGGYYFYGQQFLDEYLLYHVRRQDIKHNFSPYFYPIYLTMNNPQLASILGFGAFIPQLICIIYFALKYVSLYLQLYRVCQFMPFRYSNDLPLCWFMTTFSFVALNKVCTSQYFVWYLMYLPLICYKINVSLIKTLFLHKNCLDVLIKSSHVDWTVVFWSSTLAISCLFVGISRLECHGSCLAGVYLFFVC